MAVDFLFKDNDLYFDSDSDISFTTTTQLSLTQRLYIRFNTWVGQWRYDTTFGFPIYAFIRGLYTTESEVKSELKSLALEEDDVTSVEISSLEWDHSNRVITSCTMVVTTEEGTITIPVAAPVERINDYGTPRDKDDITLCTIDDDDLTGINYLHANLYDLDSMESSSWWKDWQMDDDDKANVDNAITTNLTSGV